MRVPKAQLLVASELRQVLAESLRIGKTPVAAGTLAVIAVKDGRKGHWLR
jgi:hypothetical protein